jgi:hypothetical protein
VALGWPLMAPAMSAEGTDAFDSVSRSLNYLFAHPWRYLAYHAVAALYAIPALWFFCGFACWMSRVALKTAGFGMGSAFGGFCVASILKVGIFAAAAGFAVSFAFSAWTIMYFLLRKVEDGTEFSVVYEEGAQGWNPEA